MLRILSLLLLAVGFLISCSPDGHSIPYPGPAYPGPGTSNTIVTSTDKGSIIGSLTYIDNGNPVRHQVFYAAKLLPAVGTTTDGYVASVDPTIAPRGESDEYGNITINLIPPGRYALIVMTPTSGAILVIDASTEKEIMFEVTAGQVTNLGRKSIAVNSSTLEP